MLHHMATILVCYSGHFESKMVTKIQKSSDLGKIWFPSRLWCYELVSIVWEPCYDPSDHIISCFICFWYLSAYLFYNCFFSLFFFWKRGCFVSSFDIFFYNLFWLHLYLQLKGNGGLHVFLNSVMNPHIVDNNLVDLIGNVVRQITLDTIGLVCILNA
jgi:hypothetical protein